jgi:hypothetical protein
MREIETVRVYVCVRERNYEADPWGALVHGLRTIMFVPKINLVDLQHAEPCRLLVLPLVSHGCSCSWNEPIIAPLFTVPPCDSLPRSFRSCFYGRILRADLRYILLLS